MMVSIPYVHVRTFCSLLGAYSKGFDCTNAYSMIVFIPLCTCTYLPFVHIVEGVGNAKCLSSLDEKP